ncbi:MAG TPA: DUF4783 domain-containing protein [Bacteroidales bacterium]|nr:DUF4783 domain-containing protein [Bacteroidales bacterium]HSA43499.1 DUF4783 domain-containing protein [Bacteroidales bacterium]
MMSKSVFKAWPVLALLLLAALMPRAQSQGTDMQKDIAGHIRSGDVTALSAFFGQSVDLNVPGNENTYSKAQAELILKDFFGKNPPASFKINHQGTSKDGSRFFIGTYAAVNGKNFRTYCLMKKTGDRFLLQQLQFEPD